MASLEWCRVVLATGKYVNSDIQNKACKGGKVLISVLFFNAIKGDKFANYLQHTVLKMSILLCGTGRFRQLS